MKKIFHFIQICAVLFLGACGAPRLDGLTPNSGPPHTLVSLNGDAILSTVFWDADQPSRVRLPGGFLGGGPFSVPPDAALGQHQVQITRRGESSAMVPFTVTAPVVPWPAPFISFISSYDPRQIPNTDSVSFFLFVQGGNIDIGATIRFGDLNVPSFLYRALIYNSASHDITTLGYPIHHYSMVYATVKARIGDPMRISIQNLDNVASNELLWTIPTLADWDSDGDGLLDTWETNGFDREGDGTIECDLPAMGSDPLVFDLYVEVDFMNGANGQPRLPNNDMWGMVENSFRNAPLINIRLGSQGIRLHADRGQNTHITITGSVENTPEAERKGGGIIPFADYLRMEAGNSPLQQDGETTANFYTLKMNNFSSGRREIFHYCIFGTKFGDSNQLNTGRGENLGNDFYITLNDNSIARSGRCAGTFLHELGHNLGLMHGGNDNLAHKPNHVSVMSYYSFAVNDVPNSYQFGGADIDCNAIPDGVYDYSHGMLRGLNENALNEALGTCDNVPLDWDGSGNITNNVVANIDRSDATQLNDHNNWRFIQFNFRNDGDYQD